MQTTFVHTILMHTVCEYSQIDVKKYVKKGKDTFKSR